MNLSEFSKQYDQIKGFKHKDGMVIPFINRQILSAENCYNPILIRYAIRQAKAFSAEDVNALNEKYFSFISNLREAIESKKIETLISVLEAFYLNLFVGDPEELNFFLQFEGIFSGCTWFKNNREDFPNDIICKEQLKGQIFSPFIEKTDSPSNKIMDIFDGREDVKTDAIGSLKFENPFSQILRGNINGTITDNPFDNAKRCLKNKYFISEYLSNQTILSKRIYSRYEAGEILFGIGLNRKTYQNRMNSLIAKYPTLVIFEPDVTKFRINITVLKKNMPLRKDVIDSL